MPVIGQLCTMYLQPYTSMWMHRHTVVLSIFTTHVTLCLQVAVIGCAYVAAFQVAMRGSLYTKQQEVLYISLFVQ